MTTAGKGDTSQSDTTQPPPAIPTPSVATTVGTASSDDTVTVEFDGGGAAAFDDALDRLRDAPGGTLQLAPGTYHLDASRAPTYEYPRDDDRVHVDGTGLDGVTIAGPPPDAAGTAEIRLADPTRGFVLFRNPAGATGATRPRGPTVRDLTVRHDTLPYTHGAIVDHSNDRRTITLTLPAGVPQVDDRPFTGHDPLVISANVFTTDGDRIRRVTDDERSNFKRFETIERTGDRRVRLVLADGVEAGGIRTGRRLVLLPRHLNATTFIHADVTEPRYERVRVESSANFAFEFNACDRPILRDCVVAPPDDTVGLVATNADGIHANNCPRGPVVEGCTLARTSDDAVVADTELMAVRSLVDNHAVAVYADFGTRVAAGDRIVAATPALERIGVLPAVESVDERGGGVTGEPVNPEVIRFTDPIDETLSVGDALVGPRMRNRETVVRDTTVRSTRARYVRFGGVAGGLVEGNRFLGTNSDGIEVTAAGDVREGFSDLKGWSTDVRIRDNEVVDTGLVGVPSGIPRGICIGVDGGEGPAPAPSLTGRPHRNIRLADNTVSGVAGHGIELADVVGVTLSGDRVESPGVLSDASIAQYGLGVRNAEDVTVDAVTVMGAAHLDGFGWTHASEAVSATNSRFVVDGTDEPGRFVDLDG